MSAPCVTVWVGFLLVAGALLPSAEARHNGGPCGEDGDLVNLGFTCVYECGSVIVGVLSYCLINNARCLSLRENLGLPSKVEILGITIVEFCNHIDCTPEKGKVPEGCECPEPPPALIQWSACGNV